MFQETWEHLGQQRRILNVTNEYANIIECHNTCFSHSLIQEQLGCQAAIAAPAMPEEHNLFHEQVGDMNFSPELCRFGIFDSYWTHIYFLFKTENF